MGSIIDFQGALFHSAGNIFFAKVNIKFKP